ncbi:MAG: hypothetical protein EOP24_16645 [Hyphomicrobiales bacterium]|nr:MAG: hypothetical protein EOP24_16645 [Hyphomicrobiales bacterium]
MQDDLSNTTPDEGLTKVMTFMAKAGLGMLPGGSVLAELVTLVVIDPAQKRRDWLLNNIVARVEDLEREGVVSLDELADDERVSAIVLTAVQAAQRSIGEQKLRDLANATMQGIASVSERDRVTISINIIDRLTEAHIVALRMFAQAEGQLEDQAVHAFFLKHFESTPALSLDPRDPFFPVLWRDLFAQGLVTETISQAFGGGDPFYVTSPLGRFVLDHIGWKAA